MEISIPKSIATDVIRLLNENGYMLFVRPDRSLTIKASNDAHAHELIRRAGEVESMIKTSTDPQDAFEWHGKLYGLLVTAREAFGDQAWVAKDIEGILDSVSKIPS